METQNVFNSKAVKKFVKSTSIMFGLLVVLFYSFATLILFFGKSTDSRVFILTCVLAFFPVLFFIGFFCWMKLHYKKLCWVLGLKSKENSVGATQTGVICGVCPFVATSITCSVIKEGKTHQEQQLDKIHNLLSEIKTNIGRNYPKSKILWVNDAPNCNTCVREVLRLHGITVDLVKNTKDAIEALEKDNSYVAIIYTMNNNRDDKEEENFRTEVRKKNVKISIFTDNGK